MNFFTKYTVVALSLAVGFFSCENPELAPTEPGAPATDHATSSPELPLGSTAKAYFLKKLNTQTFTYYPNGKLWKVITPSGRYNEYEYGPNWVSSTLYKADKKREQKEVFLLNDKGNAFESYVYSFDNQGTTTTLRFSNEYAYNTSNQLIRINLKNQPNERRLFSYDAGGDLTRMEKYNASNIKTIENTYSYELPGVARQLDHDPLNEYFELNTQGEFLNIFGKMNKHLLRRYAFKSLYTNQVVDEKILYYTLKPDGLVQNYTQFDVEANVMLNDKVNYEYAVNP